MSKKGSDSNSVILLLNELFGEIDSVKFIHFCLVFNFKYCFSFPCQLEKIPNSLTDGIISDVSILHLKE